MNIGIKVEIEVEDCQDDDKQIEERKEKINDRREIGRAHV